MLQSGAAVARGSRQKATRSPLAGKLFDETGDRLTPSHRKERQKTALLYLPQTGQRSQPETSGCLAAACRSGGGLAG